MSYQKKTIVWLGNVWLEWMKIDETTCEPAQKWLMIAGIRYVDAVYIPARAGFYFADECISV